ncbi:MAG: penicillin-binding protein, partial [Candidatus Dormibacteraeota bacterium]|nr:penicillin-binding protein [Candidatus Dormibacteraeota bacterium]
SAYTGPRRRAPRKGGDLPKGRAARWLPNLAKVGLVTMVGLAAFLGSSQGYINFAAELPDAHNLTSSPLPEDTLVYAGDGSEMADIHPSGTQHYYQSLDESGKWLPQATVAIEDSNYWNEPGIDPTGIARAFLTNSREGRTSQGASTITQQLVKLRLLKDPSATYDRKIKEAILALQVEHTYSKRQILEMYLNTVEYGNNAEGAEAASQNYFRKDTKDLNLAEASMLAGIPQNPNFNSPWADYQVAKNRQAQVLNSMVHSKMVTQEQANEAFAVDLRPELHTPDSSIKQAPEFVNWVVQQLADKYGEKAAYEGGLRVYTTLDPKIQQIAESSVKANVAKNLSHNMHQGAMVSIDPKTGGVTAMVGSAYPDKWGGQYNYAADIPRNPGSSFKVFNYTAAITSRKFTMNTPVPDQPLTVNYTQPPYQPKNFNATQYPSCVLQTCLGNSLNIPAVFAELSVGVDNVLQTARQMGAPPWAEADDGSYTRSAPSNKYGPSLTLGGYGETPLQMATGVATLASGGIYHPTTGVSKVTTSDGSPIFTDNPATNGKQVVDPAVAYIMTAMLSNDANRQQEFGQHSALTLPGRNVAAKTGTSENYTDAWTVGYTPSLASAFWFGNENGNVSLGQGFDAIYAAAPGWQGFMATALGAMKDPANDWYGAPAGVVPAGNSVWVLPGTSPNQATPGTPPGVTLSAPPPNSQGNKPNQPNNNKPSG